MVRIFIRDEDECGNSTVSAPETLQQFKVPILFGRNAELEQLHHAWRDSATHLFAISAASGVGKTALIERWLYDLQQHYWHDAEAVYVWSFYPKTPANTFSFIPKELAQQHHEQRNAALGEALDEFFHHALQWFGDHPANALTPLQQAERLARQIQANHTLLILDGLEHFLRNENSTLHFSDPRLFALLERLTEYNPGLCVVMTQQTMQPVFSAYEAARYLTLPALTTAAGVQLLRQKGVQGTEAKLLEIIHDHELHAQTLQLLGGYLAYWHQGNWLGLEHIPVLFDKQVAGRHIRRLLTANAHCLASSGAETIVLLLSLNKQPLDRQTLLELLQHIPSSRVRHWFSRWSKHGDTLTEVVYPFKHLNKSKQLQVFRQLQQLGLLCVSGRKVYLPDVVRTFFFQQFRQDYPLAWQAAQHLLDQYLISKKTAIPPKLFTTDNAQVHQAVNDLPRLTVHSQPTKARHVTLPVPQYLPAQVNQRVTPLVDIPMPAAYARATRDLPASPPLMANGEPPLKTFALSTTPTLPITPDTTALQPLATLVDIERVNQLIPQIEDFQRSLQILQQRTRKFQKSMRQLDKAVQSIH